MTLFSYQNWLNRTLGKFRIFEFSSKVNNQLKASFYFQNWAHQPFPSSCKSWKTKLPAGYDRIGKSTTQVIVFEEARNKTTLNFLEANCDQKSETWKGCVTLTLTLLRSRIQNVFIELFFNCKVSGSVRFFRNISRKKSKIGTCPFNFGKLELASPKL